MGSERPRSFKQALEAGGALTEEEMARVPRAFDITGDIAVLELPLELRSKWKAVGEALLSFYPNVRVVARKATPVRGELRTREVEVIAGEPRTTTLHLENNCRFRVDVQSVYFSPRLGSERLRVAKAARAGENVLVLFAGVGPYAILVAKLQPSASVFAVELNPAARAFLEENVRLNKVSGRVEFAIGDVHQVLQEPRLQGWADRIVMPLPERAAEFLGDALRAARRGCVVHYYAFGSVAKGADTYGPSLEAIERACLEAGRRCEVLAKGECGTHAPREARIVVDFRVL